MSDLARQIDVWLLSRWDWVSEGELCSRFGIDERKLRSTADKPGLVSAFAISGNKGYRHVRAATDAEWDRFETRIRVHSIGQLKRIKDLRATRRNQLTGPRHFPIESTTGQGLLLP